MLLLAPARVADSLRDETLPERTRFHLCLLGTVLATLSGRSAAFRNYGELSLALLFLAVILLGLRSCYRANGGPNGRRFVERYVCLTVPVGIRVYGTYYLLYYGAYFLFRRGGGVPPHAFGMAQWLPASTTLAAMLAFYWVLCAYIRRAAGFAA